MAKEEKQGNNGRNGADQAQTSGEQTGAKPKGPLPKQKKQARPGIEKEMTPKPQYMAPAYKGSGKLKNLAAIVTGGDSGIGRSVAVLFAREGADVAIVHLPVEKVDAKETIAAVEAEGRRCISIPGDVKDPKFCQRAVAKAQKEFGRLDVLVNNAAFQHHQKSLEEISDEQFEETFRTNIFGYFYMAKAALKFIPEGGAIVNTGSITGLEGNKELIDYSATKGAIHAFTKSLAQNLAERKIRVNCVSPGPVWTPLNVADKDPEEVAKHGADTPMKRPGQPEEIAPAFVFFASNIDSSYISGEVFTILGGETRAA
ncbi:MAG TPA: SDR family oxidoreductase [Pyrinomonadaceae bacterium]|nr:SDR family oxidoreductase [Pyrinomonadaceae bacterium]